VTRAALCLALALAGCGAPLPDYTPLVAEELGRDIVSGLGAISQFREDETLEAGEGKRVVFSIVNAPHGLPAPRIRDYFERTKARIQAVASVSELKEEADGGVVRYATAAVTGELDLRVKPSGSDQVIVRLTFLEKPLRP
jgi:hypothetical protein